MNKQNINNNLFSHLRMHGNLETAKQYWKAIQHILTPTASYSLNKLVDAILGDKEAFIEVMNSYYHEHFHSNEIMATKLLIANKTILFNIEEHNLDLSIYYYHYNKCKQNPETLPFLKFMLKEKNGFYSEEIHDIIDQLDTSHYENLSIGYQCADENIEQLLYDRYPKANFFRAEDPPIVLHINSFS